MIRRMIRAFLCPLPCSHGDLLERVEGLMGEVEQGRRDVVDLSARVTLLTNERTDLMRRLTVLQGRHAGQADAIREDMETIAALRAELAALKDAQPEGKRARAEVPVNRRLGILRAADVLADLGPNPTADQIAVEMRRDSAWDFPVSTLARWVSDVAAEGYLTGDGKKPRGYTLSEKGRAVLAPGSVSVMAGVKVGATICDACEHDRPPIRGVRQCAANPRVDLSDWIRANCDDAGNPTPTATNCPGWTARDATPTQSAS